MSIATLRIRILEHLRTTAGNCATVHGLASLLGVAPFWVRAALQALERQGLAESAGYGPYADGSLTVRVVLWVLA